MSLCSSRTKSHEATTTTTTTTTAIVVIVCEGEMETCVCSFKGTLVSLGEFRSALVLPHWGGPGGGALRRAMLWCNIVAQRVMSLPPQSSLQPPWPTSPAPSVLADGTEFMSPLAVSVSLRRRLLAHWHQIGSNHIMTARWPRPSTPTLQASSDWDRQNKTDK